MQPFKNEITPEQLENCHKLISYALSGNLKAEFDMSDFTDEQDVNKEEKKVTCGTVGCFAGHGPYAGVEKLKTEDWFKYTRRQFGINYGDSGSKWTWIFDTDWVKIDNTPEGAAGRLLYLLEYGLPKNWYKIMGGKENYSKEIEELIKNYDTT